MKDEDCPDEGSVKNDPCSDSDSNDKDGAKDEADVRDVRYNLETLFFLWMMSNLLKHSNVLIIVWYNIMTIVSKQSINDHCMV